MFDSVAELYDRTRPGYPPQVFADLAELAGIGPGCRVLEIGCGTGQATAPLAEHGCSIVAVELGTGLAAVARRNLARFSTVEVVVSAFESWPVPAELFDLVFSATAFHWVDPEVRVIKASQALRPGGVLATIATHHVAGGTEEFFVEAQDCYERWDPETEPGFRLPEAGAVPFDTEDLEAGGFGQPVFKRYQWEQSYSAAAYCDLLRTYSGHQAMEPAGLRGLLDCISRLIDSNFGGRIEKRYLTELRVAIKN